MALATSCTLTELSSMPATIIGALVWLTCQVINLFYRLIQLSYVQESACTGERFGLGAGAVQSSLACSGMPLRLQWLYHSSQCELVLHEADALHGRPVML